MRWLEADEPDYPAALRLLVNPPVRARFLQRNRVIAGLCLATIVVEGREDSGSLNTARHAAEADRDVYAVPGPVDSPESAAPFLLLKEGAAPVRSIADVWSSLAPYAPALSSFNRNDEVLPSSGARALSLVEQKILQCLGSHTRTLEQLGQAAALDIVRLSTILLDMELNDLIQSLPGQRYAQKRNH